MNVDAILRAKGTSVATIAPDATVAGAVHELKTRGIGALVVSEDGRSVAGILSERDIVHALAEHGADAALGEDAGLDQGCFACYRTNQRPTIATSETE